MNTTLEHILVPIDGSECSRNAVRFATMLARCADSKLSVIHVHHVNSVELMGLVSQSKEELDAALQRLSKSVTDAARAVLEEEAIDATVEVTIGDPAVEVVEYARRHGVDLIVMGSRGRGRIKSLLLGSVSHKVMTLASCSVTIVR